MVQRAFNNVTIPAAGANAPNDQGWTDAVFQNRTSVRADVTLRTVDLNDATLSIQMAIEISNDPNGVTGWQTLVGETWNGGPQGRDQTAKQPVLGPYSTTAWPPFQRMRLHGLPSRQITGVDVVMTAV